MVSLILFSMTFVVFFSIKNKNNFNGRNNQDLPNSVIKKEKQEKERKPIYKFL